jgi:rhomboid protease GluP
MPAMKRSLVVWLLSVANLLAYLTLAVSDVAWLSPSAEALQRWGASYGPLITSGEWWRLPASAFLSTGLQQLLIGLWLLFVAGAVAERLFGHLQLLVIYLLSAAGGALLSVYWQPASTVAAALPAAFGLCGALLALVARFRTAVPPEERSSLRNAGLALVVACVVLGLVTRTVNVPGLAGGLVVGVLAGFALAQPGVSLAHGARVRRAALTALAGVAVFGLAAWSLPVEDDWRKDIQVLFALDGDAQSAIDEATQGVAAGRMSREAYGDYVRREVLPSWRQHRERLVALRLPPRPRAIVDKAIVYMDRRAASWELVDDRPSRAAAADAGRDFMRELGFTRRVR